MTKTVTLTIAQTTQSVLPSGRTFAGFKFTLATAIVATPPVAPAEVTTTALSADFTDAAPGDYVGSVCAVDSAGLALSPVITINLTVPPDAAPPPPPPPAEFTAPTALSFTLS